VVARRLGPVNFDDRLTLVQHLDELRTRLIIAGAAFAVAFGLCLWQNHLLLDIANEPLPGDEKLITFGVSEPFMTTVTVAAYGAIVIALPVILYQLYAFILPALTPGERGVALPLLLVIPVLFIAGVVFAYFVVLPAALKFLLNFNDDQFNVQVRAREYYSFFAVTLVALGLLFQVPIVILALTRLGITTPEQLAHNRRYAILVIAVIAMLLPGTDPVTMLISMVPLIVLFEGSLLLARVFGRPSWIRGEAPPGEPTPEPPG
jgi:sec-independent protein translocase protein TatC